ncbi:MAG: flagellar biosynthesis protein FlgC [Alphaproteobacteria bacterium CG_4_9_14_3_um_filter_47_13]|nr:MAG: flagellar biosynthesis protein FlgC [Alphaproteobacteria bacterium CG_4_9_14_3_um_filter_47_13]
MINAIQIALSGLSASTKKVEASASNIANLTTTGSLTDPAQAPYQAVTTVQTALLDNLGTGQGVKSEILPKNTPFVPSYSPDSPFADQKGLIGISNVNLAEEAVNLNLARYEYKANLKIIEISSELSQELLRIFDDRV